LEPTPADESLLPDSTPPNAEIPSVKKALPKSALPAPVPTPAQRALETPYEAMPGNAHQGNEPTYDEGGFDSYSDSGCGGYCCGPCGGGCGSCCNDDCCVCGNHWYFFGPWMLDNLSVFSGVQSFRGPFDRGTTNFGFHEGFNWGRPLCEPLGIGVASGLRVLQSNLHGSAETNGARDQLFYTAQIYRRAQCGCGPQWGVASDSLYDRGNGTLSVNQVRGELSILNGCGGEVGSWVAIRTSTATVNEVQYRPTDMYAFFFRKNGCNGNYIRGWGGFTSGRNSAGIVGADAVAQLSRRTAIQANFNYRLPHTPSDANSYLQEAWGLGISLVFTPGPRGGRSACADQFRPLMNVADNSNFFVSP
jgi:hypothetical protein